MNIDYSNINIPLTLKIIFFYGLILSFILVKIKHKFIFLSVILLALYFERFVFMVTYYGPQQYDFTNSNCEVIVPINKNTNFAFIISTLRYNSCFIHSDNAPQNIIEFCKYRKCFNNKHNDVYPIPFSRYRKTYCEETSTSFLKVDDNTFLSPDCYKRCKQYCDSKFHCCVCGNKQGDPLSGMTHGQFHFPLGAYYYANTASKIALCTATVRENLNEDQGIALNLQSKCNQVEYFNPGVECGVKRTFNYLDTETKIVKSENH